MKEETAVSEPTYTAKQVMDCLLKQLLMAVYENGYPSEVVPKATILSLPALLKIEYPTPTTDTTK